MYIGIGIQPYDYKFENLFERNSSQKISEVNCLKTNQEQNKALMKLLYNNKECITREFFQISRKSLLLWAQRKKESFTLCKVNLTLKQNLAKIVIIKSQ